MKSCGCGEHRRTTENAQNEFLCNTIIPYPCHTVDKETFVQSGSVKGGVALCIQPVFCRHRKMHVPVPMRHQKQDNPAIGHNIDTHIPASCDPGQSRLHRPLLNQFRRWFSEVFPIDFIFPIWFEQCCVEDLLWICHEVGSFSLQVTGPNTSVITKGPSCFGFIFL